jgi:hypothetical protein
MPKVVQVRIQEDEIGVYDSQAHIQSMPRLIGRAHQRVNYRHVRVASAKARRLCPLSLPR